MGTTTSITAALKTPELPVLETVTCDLCGADRPAPVFCRPDGLRVVECEGCGLLYLNPRPTSDVIDSWYGLDYFSGDASAVGRGYADYLTDRVIPDLLLAAKLKLALVSDHLDLSKATVLELGCATGETCCSAANNGACVIGCDLSSEAIKVARLRYPHIQFLPASGNNLPFPSESFDAVFAFELIEHVPSPSAFIAEISRLLRPGGILALSTPNAECGRTLGWPRWKGFLTSFEHLHFFDLTTLERTLMQRGLTVVGTYSQGEGQLADRSSSDIFKSVLRGIGLFNGAKALYRATLAPRILRWARSSKFHTLMVVARKPSTP